MTYEADQAGTLKIVAQEGDTLAGRRDDRVDRRRQQRRVGRHRGTAERRGRRGARSGAERARGDRRGRGGAGVRARRGARPRRRRPSRRGDGGNGGRAKASPVARRMARELGLELGQLQGTGPGGRIVKADVEAAAKGDGAKAAPAEAEAPRPSPSPRRSKAPPAVVSGDGQTGKGETTTQDLTRLQQTVARRMAESKATAPGVRPQHRRRHGGGRRPAQAAQGGRRRGPAGAVVQRLRGQGLGARAASTSRAPTAPTATASSSSTRASTSASRWPARTRSWCRPCSTPTRKSLGQIARESRALAERVRAGAITPPELSSRHVHRLEPRHVRDPELRRGHQPAAGGDPRRRRDGSRRRWCATARSWSATSCGSRSPATTASSTAPTPPSSSRRIRERLENPLQLAL